MTGQGSVKKPLELYVHIPFCVRKCGYCDFLSAPAGQEVRRAYVEQLLREIQNAEALSGRYEAATVFFGGGTPSILKPELLLRILAELRRRFSFRPDAEITLEANPGTVDRDSLFRYREAGVNRLSFGLQSADNRELELLGRIHTWETFLESWHLAGEAGFDNLNVDLMSALPGQTVEGYRETVKKVQKLSPEHISAYSLILEEGTPFMNDTPDRAGFCRRRTKSGRCITIRRSFWKRRGTSGMRYPTMRSPDMPAAIIWATGSGRIIKDSDLARRRFWKT